MEISSVEIQCVWREALCICRDRAFGDTHGYTRANLITPSRTLLILSHPKTLGTSRRLSEGGCHENVPCISDGEMGGRKCSKSALEWSSAVTSLVRLLVGWLEKLQNRNRFGALIGFQLVSFEAL